MALIITQVKWANKNWLNKFHSLVWSLLLGMVLILTIMYNPDPYYALTSILNMAYYPFKEQKVKNQSIFNTCLSSKLYTNSLKF